METEVTGSCNNDTLQTECEHSESCLKSENFAEGIREEQSPVIDLKKSNNILKDVLDEQHEILPQENTPETKLHQNHKTKKGRRKERLKRKRKERTSKLVDSSETAEDTDFIFMRKRRQDLTLRAKVKVLEMLDGEPRVAQGRIASLFRVSQSQVSRIMKNKEAILVQWNQFATPERKRCRLGKAGALEQKLVEWYKEARNEDLPISGPILMEKAKSIGVEMGREFKPTAGWLGRWKDRNGINLKVFKDKDGTQSISKVANHWRRYMFAKATRDISFQNIWVVDETVLSYDLVPDFVVPGPCEGNDRIYVILACNIAGTERKPAAVVGTLPSMEYVSLPISYYYNAKGEITIDHFSSWLRDWDRELRLRKKKIVILLNRAHHHPENLQLSNISLTYFPVGTAKVLQPLQLGIISCFRALYRHLQLKHTVSKAHASNHVGHSSNMFYYDSTLDQSSLIEKVSHLDAIYMIFKAWKHVSPETIVKGAVKAGLSKDVEALKVNDTVAAPPGINQEDFDNFLKADSEMNLGNQNEIQNTNISPTSTASQYHNYTDVAGTQSKTPEIREQINTSQNLPPLPKASEALFACHVLKKYLHHQGGRLLDEFVQLESAIQLDVILEDRPDLKNYHMEDPFHDVTSVHSIHSHRQALNAKQQYLEKVRNAHNQKTLQKEMKKVNATSLPFDSSVLSRTQEMSSGTVQQHAVFQRHEMPGPELPSQNVQEEIPQPVQRPDLVPQDMGQLEYGRDMAVEGSRPAVYEMRPVNMSTVFRPLQPTARCNPSDHKTAGHSTLPTDLRSFPLSDHRMSTSHHPGHTNELAQIRQADTRLENSGIPYYALQNPLHHYMQPK